MSNELFEKTPIPIAYMKLAIPVVLGMVVTLVYNMVDTYFIALTGNTALIAGVSICTPLFTLFLAFGDMIALGGASVISRLLGAAGAAIASIIGYICSTLFAFWFISFKCEGISINPKDFGIKANELGMIFAVGIPASVTNLMQTVGITLTNKSLSPYGSDSIAVMGIVLKIVNIVMLVIVGLAFGGQPLTGYVYGSGDRKRLKKVLTFAYEIVLGVSAVMALIVALLANPLIKAFLKDDELIKMGVLMLRLQMPGMLLMGMGLVTICAFQSMGKGLPALILSLCRQGVVYAVSIGVLSAMFGFNGVICAQLGSDVISVIIAGVLFLIFIKPEFSSNK